jgi:hypothetical protein
LSDIFSEALFVERIHAPIDLPLETETGSAGAGQIVIRDRLSAPWISLRSIAVTLRSQIDFTDAILFTYLAAVIRQYFWAVDNVPAWTLTIAAALVLSGLHVSRRAQNSRPFSKQFWLIVALPLFFFFALRVPFPDQDFDVLNYHLVNASRAMSGWPFIAGDFFPTVAAVNPAPNVAGGLFRFVLGYRLGTIINLGALLWAGLIVNRFLSPYIKNQWMRAAGVLFAISTEYILRLLNDYRVDLLSVPLLLEATYLAIRFADVRRKSYTIIHIALFLGLSAGFKLSNLAFVIPIGILVLVQIFRHRSQVGFKAPIAAFVALAAPLVPFAYFMYRETGNPLFPFFNKIFKSPYLPAINPTDVMYGPRTFIELIVWPVWAFFTPDRISEMSGIGVPYTGRLSLGFVVCILCLFSKAMSKELRLISILTIAGCLTWAGLSGNVRYALYLEILSGVVILGVFSTLYKTARETGKQRSRELVLFVLLFGGLLLAQTAGAYGIAYWRGQALFDVPTQHSVFQQPRLYLAESKNLLRDRTATQYLPVRDRQLFDKVDVWINSYYTTNGVEVSLRPGIPMLSVCDYMNSLDYLRKHEARQLFASKLEQVRGKRMYSVSPSRSDFLELSLYFITRAGLTVGEVTPVDLPYYSSNMHRQMLLIEVLPADQGKGKDQVDALVEQFGAKED